MSLEVRRQSERRARIPAAPWRGVGARGGRGGVGGVGEREGGFVLLSGMVVRVVLYKKNANAKRVSMCEDEEGTKEKEEGRETHHLHRSKLPSERRG